MRRFSGGVEELRLRREREGLVSVSFGSGGRSGSDLRIFLPRIVLRRDGVSVR